MQGVDRSILKCVPQGPGIYRMYGPSDALVYVGKAKSLRKRLACYWRSSAEDSRKLLSLKRWVRRIDWEETESEKAALLLENRLLRELRPIFNVMNTRPDIYPYLLLRESECVDGRVWCRLGTTRAPKELQPRETLYGAFRARRLLNNASAAIFRLLAQRSQLVDPTLLSPQKRGWVGLSLSELRELKSYLSGTRSRFMATLYTDLWERGAFEDPLSAKRLDEDFALLRSFYEQGPQRNRMMRLRLKLGKDLIQQESLDDLIVEMKFLNV